MFNKPDCAILTIFSKLPRSLHACFQLGHFHCFDPMARVRGQLEEQWLLFAPGETRELCLMTEVSSRPTERQLNFLSGSSRLGFYAFLAAEAPPVSDEENAVYEVRHSMSVRVKGLSSSVRPDWAASFWAASIRWPSHAHSWVAFRPCFHTVNIVSFVRSFFKTSSTGKYSAKPAFIIGKLLDRCFHKHKDQFSELTSLEHFWKHLNRK